MYYFLLKAAEKADANVFETMSNPIINLIDSALPSVIALVGAIGVIYCVFLGLKLAKAEEPQDREKAKGHLKNAIVGFLLIFILMVALKTGIGPLQDWVAEQGTEETQTTTKKAS